MTWERLLAELDDLDQQAAGAFAAERQLEVEERARSAYAEVTLWSRLMAAVDATVLVRVLAVGELGGRVVQVGDGWCLLAVRDREWLVPRSAVVAVVGLRAGSVPAEAWPVTSRLGFGAALRQVAEDGSECELRLTDGSALTGRLGRVGADFVEVDRSGHPCAVAFDGLAAVLSRAP